MAKTGEWGFNPGIWVSGEFYPPRPSLKREGEFYPPRPSLKREGEFYPPRPSLKREGVKGERIKMKINGCSSVLNI